MKPVVTRWTIGVAVSVAALAAACQVAEPQSAGGTATERSTFSEPREQARQFINDYHSIPLTPEQAAIKKQALSSIPAPCCKDYSIATCCCPCNLVKSVWGLANHLIVERDYGVDQVSETVREWLHFTNPRGAAGNACDEGRCGLPFAQDGCGGMNEARIS